MASGWAVSVTVVGVACILALLAVLARYLGLWTWAMAWLRAAREEKARLCRGHRTTSTRSYLFDNDLDWIGLWPRTGSYKRFTNLDDLTSMASVDDSLRTAEEHDLPPQPLRPAPAPPPSRMPGSGEGSPSPASSGGVGVDTPPEPSRPAPMLDRRDSSRSLTGRLSRRDSSKELLVSSQQSSPKRASTNPFRASWVPPDESSETSFAQASFSMEAGPSPAAWGQPVGRYPAPFVSKTQQIESVATVKEALAPPPAAAATSTTGNLWGPATPLTVQSGNVAGEAVGACGSHVGDKSVGTVKAAYTAPSPAPQHQLYSSSALENNVSVNISKDNSYSVETTNDINYDARHRESSARANDTVTDVGGEAVTLSGNDQPSRVMNGDQHQTASQATVMQGDQHQPNPRMQQLLVSTDMTYHDSQLTSDLGRSYEVPAAPPNTATCPVSPHSPHISSRLAEVEARMRLLGAPSEQPRDTSQDWWPTESSCSVVREQEGRRAEGRKNPFLVSLGSSGSEREPGGLSSVDEEVFLLQDADPSLNRTNSSRVSHTVTNSDSSVVSGSTGVVAVESEEDASARRVREYLASLSARLRQLPDEDDLPNSTPDFIETPPTSATFPTTPPNSAARASSHGFTETPPHSAEPYSTSGLARPSTPSSASLRNMYSNRRSSTEVSPVSPGVFTLSTNRRLSLDTPPSSAGIVTATPPNSATSQVAFGETPPSSAGYSSTPPSSAGLTGSLEAGMAGAGVGAHTLKRAVSCDSVSSDTSVTLGELEEACGHITGHLSVQLIYDSDTADLEVVVVEGRDLVGPDPHAAVDSYVRVFLLPDKSTNMQTRVCRRTNNPTYREKFLFALEPEELGQRCLAFYMYASDKFTNTLIGEAHLRLTDVDMSVPLATVLPLTDTGQLGVGYGEIMFSLSYLPTAERLTVVVVKARSLQWTAQKTTADPFVKVYVLQNGKKVMKKKTSIKKDTRSPVFNEAMIFSVPAPALHNIQLRVTVAEHNSDGGQARSVGHVIVGTQATGKALSHWNQMMSALRKPIGMWHPIRR